MNWISVIAVFFVLWWLVLFTQLPIGLRTQDDEQDVTLGTPASAPGRPQMLGAIIRTTILTAILVGLFYWLTRGLGYGFDDIPRLVPEYLVR